MPWSCQRRPAAPVPAPPPNYYQIGETAFEAGEYTRAIEAYRAYIEGTPGGLYIDRALFRMAMAYSLPESPERDAARANELLEELIRNYPTSPFHAAAELLMQQETELRGKQAELELQQAEVQRLLADLGSRESQVRNLTQELDELGQARQAELQQLRTEVAAREERIRQLSQELERLKQIDLRRRPPTSLP